MKRKLNGYLKLCGSSAYIAYPIWFLIQPFLPVLYMHILKFFLYVWHINFILLLIQSITSFFREYTLRRSFYISLKEKNNMKKILYPLGKKEKKSHKIFQVQKQLQPIWKQFYYLYLKLSVKSKELVYYRTAHIWDYRRKIWHFSLIFSHIDFVSLPQNY